MNIIESKPDTAALDRIFAALADPTRREILRRLASGPAPVGELVEPFDISQPAVSKHLRVLADAGLVSREPRGQQRLAHLSAAPMRAASDYLAEFKAHWDARLDQLGAVLAELVSITERKEHD